MLLKRSIDWDELEVKRKSMNRKDLYILIGVGLFLVLAVIGLFYVVKHFYD